MDFCRIKTRPGKKKGVLEVYPDFVVGRIKDLMVRGKSFYAVWDEAAGMWSTDEYDVARLVDADIRAKADEIQGQAEGIEVVPKLLSTFSSGSWQKFQQYVSKVSDNYHELDEKLTFQNTETKKKDYISRRLPYAISDGECPAWDELVGTLYDKSEREKIEWAIGAVVSGDSRDIQKFLVFYGEAGSGKSTILNVIQKLFDGYFVMFDAKALTSSNNAFATEVFRSNPLVAIQHDGDLSRIEDNTKLNSIVSHELMTMNEKYKASYTARANCFLFMASNRPVKITDAKSGVIRRLIDVKPANRKIPIKRYFDLMGRIDFELGAIAGHCLSVYKALGKNCYAAYRPTDMMMKTDVFFNFVEDSYYIFKQQDSTTLRAAYAMYKQYCDDSGADFKLPMYKFREELKNYFREYEAIGRDEDGKQVRKRYSGFLAERFDPGREDQKTKASMDIRPELPEWLVLAEQESKFDLAMASVPAQYADDDGRPVSKWANVRTTLRELDTRRTHYILAGPQLVTVDFDLTDESGQKSLARNLEAAAAFPPTYAEVSKGGQGLHLGYWYDGDTASLDTIFSPGIEVKFQSPNSTIGGFPLRRRLSLCNNLDISHISSGLPKKEEKVITTSQVKDERHLRNRIASCLRKEHHGATKPEIDFIFDTLEKAYASGMPYDVTDMRPDILAFAQKSTNQAETCLKKCLKMKWHSEEPPAAAVTPIPQVESLTSNYISDGAEVETKSLVTHDRCTTDDPRATLVFFDVEVFPNLFLICWKAEGDDNVHRIFNPKPEDIEPFMYMRLVGFNNRRYDNHMLYACLIGYSVPELYDLSQRLVSGSKNAMFREAYNLSYADIYDFSSKKQSLKKFEIELGIHHQELGFPWDQPVPEDKWELVASYCENDVRATEAVWNARQADWTARKILAALSGLSVNDTTNQHTTRIIFGEDRSPQGQFNYRNMGEFPEGGTCSYPVETDHEFTVFDGKGRPVFPGYSFDAGKSVYRGEEVGEGGYVYAEPGMYRNVALLDIASMHPSSIVAENLFGDRYTARFREILHARILIKHKDFQGARDILDGKLSPFLEDEGAAKDLAGALKIAINSVYGLTSAKFGNPFRDIRNVDNIVAKRGALFMVNLKHEVQKRGFTVAHIKTDSIKIPDATPDIIRFVTEYGKLYGYNFEHEATYDRMCLVNDAVYIAKYDEAHGGEWTATGAQFQHLYIFKTLFSKEPIVFDDLCETKSVTKGALYLDYGTEEDPKPSFVGRTGQFTPVPREKGGARLVREKDGKFYAATGTKGYFWMESEVVRGTAVERDVDMRYYTAMADEAVRDISKYGSFEEFVS